VSSNDNTPDGSTIAPQAQDAAPSFPPAREYDDPLPELFSLPVLTRKHARDMIRRLHCAIRRTGDRHDYIGTTFHADDDELQWVWRARYRSRRLPSTHVAQLLAWTEDFLAFLRDDSIDGVGGIAGQAAMADVGGFMGNVRMVLKEAAYGRLHRWPPAKEALRAVYCGGGGREAYRAIQDQWFAAHLSPNTRPPTFEQGLIVFAHPTNEEWAAEARRGGLFAIPEEWSGHSSPPSAEPTSAGRDAWL
jgi:hypothetical protein